MLDIEQHARVGRSTQIDVIHHYPDGRKVFGISELLQIADTAKARGISEEEVVRDVMLSAQPTKKFVTYDELTGALLYLVSDDGANVNGNAITIDGGWTAK